MRLAWSHIVLVMVIVAGYTLVALTIVGNGILGDLKPGHGGEP